ncbi:MAG: hypothetical protein HY323_05405 [Betaproteobacteria bacterium]|nr:hypothetical protein [Betaproteobacteria bacterium]
MSRRTLEIILGLLESWHDVAHPSVPADHGRPDEYGHRILSMDPRWHAGSYAELEECLRFMRSQGRQQAYRGQPVGTLYWHVQQWWINPPRAQKMVPSRIIGYKLTANPRKRAPVWEYKPAMVALRHSNAREQKAVWGAEWVDAHWEQVAARCSKAGWTANGRAFRGLPQLPAESLKYERERSVAV